MKASYAAYSLSNSFKNLYKITKLELNFREFEEVLTLPFPGFDELLETPIFLTLAVVEIDRYSLLF